VDVVLNLKVRTALGLALLLATSRRAAAEADRESPKAQEPRTESQWYGLPIVAADIASDAALFLLPPAGLVGFTLGGPIVHWSHGHVATGFGSLALRAGADVVSFVMLSSALSCDSCSRTNLLPALIPLVAAEAIDAAALSWEPVAPSSHAAGTSRLRVEPVFAMRRSGGSVGFVGRF
jgi:hypothetical protein